MIVTIIEFGTSRTAKGLNAPLLGNDPNNDVSMSGVALNMTKESLMNEWEMKLRM